jgi:hypothetical protein
MVGSHCAEPRPGFLHAAWYTPRVYDMFSAGYYAHDFVLCFVTMYVYFHQLIRRRNTVTS